MASALECCGNTTRPLRPGRPDSTLICTQDAGHPPGEHAACDGKGHILARWADPAGPVEVWVPGVGPVVV